MVTINQLPLGPLQTNSYFIGSEATKKAVIIDPSWDGALIAQFIADSGFTLEKILLTHAHFDHVGGLNELKAVHDVPVYAHPDALPMLEHAAASAAHFGVEMQAIAPPEQTIQAGDAIAVGDLTLQVLYTPGHAPGHVSFYLPEHNVVFSGDALFRGSIGRTDLPGGDYQQLITSIESELLTLPDETQVLSGHGAATSIGQERKTNPFLQ